MRYLFIAGAVPFLILGLAHIVHTLRDIRRPGSLAPRSADVLEGMRTDTLMLTRATTVWRAWIGFNLSHGLGVVLFSGLVLYAAILHFEAVRNHAPELLIGAPVIGLVYLLLALRYWFNVPAVGTALGTALLVAGSGLALIGTA